jgi:hypothetical protein
VLDFDNANQSDPDASTAWVYLLYGATMHTVQVFEQTLAFASLVVTTDPNAKPKGTLKEQFPRIFDRWRRANQKDTAGQTLKTIEGKIPDDLYADTRALIKRRNWLAHRFFIEQLERDNEGAGRFARGTILKLIELAADGRKLTKRLHAHEVAVRASWPQLTETPPPEVQQWFRDFGELVMRGRVRAEVWAQLQAQPES